MTVLKLLRECAVGTPIHLLAANHRTNASGLLSKVTGDCGEPYELTVDTDAGRRVFLWEDVYAIKAQRRAA